MLFCQGKLFGPGPVTMLAGLFQPQLLDRCVDMRSADMQAHSVKFGELLFERGNYIRQTGKIRCRCSQVFQCSFPKLAARSC